MKILQSSIIPAISLISLALAGSLQAYIGYGTAVQDYTGSNNSVTTVGAVGAATGTTSFGLRFTGTGASVSNYNTVINHGTIYSGTAHSYYSAGIYFNASENGQSNGNLVKNYGNIIASNLNSYYSVGIGFNSIDNGETNNNTVLNLGSIQVAGEDQAVGIGFLVNYAPTCANNNIVTNEGIITVTATNGRATGMGIEAQDAVANNNIFTNKGTLSVSGASAYGFAVTGGTATGNAFINQGTLSVSGSYFSCGVYLQKNDGVIDGNTISNYGTISVAGNSDNYGIYFANGDDGSTSNHNVINNYGTLSVAGDNSWNNGIVFDDGGAADYNVINNYGLLSVTGSSSENTGVYFDTDGGSANYNTINNYGSIVVTGVNSDSYGFLFESDGGPVIGNTINNYGNVVVSGAYAGGFYFDDQGSAITNNVINNYGRIVVSGSYEAVGIALRGDGSEVTGNIINNQGIIAVSGSDATGIVFNQANGNTIVNWGTIASSGTAINIIDGNNNTITLTGHSNVQGLIAATGSNNVLNLNFTGVNAGAKANLIAQLNAIGALSGTDSAGTFTFRGVTYTYDPLIVNVSTSSYAEQAKTPNQKAIGANLDSFTVNPTGNMLSMLNALDQSGNVPNGLEQLSPQRYQIYGDIALSNASLLTGLVDQRLNNVRFGSESIDTSSLGVSYGSVQSKLGMGSNGLPIVAAKESKEVVTVAPEKRWSAFLSGNVGHASLNDTDDLQNSKFSDSGVIGGVDVKLNDAWTTGLLLGYGHTDAQLDTQGSSADVDAYSAGLYSGYRQGNFYGNGLAAYTYNTYDSGRVVDFGSFSEKAKGHTTGSQFTVNLDGGYDQPVTKNISVGPFVGLQYVHMGVDGFNESQANAANLNINDQAMDSLRSRVGLRVELKKDLSKNWKAASELRAAWQHEFANNDRAIVAQFAGSGLSSFAVRTSDPERDRAVLGIGLNATCQDTLTVFADYDAEVGTRYTEQIFKGGLKLNF